MTNDQKKLTTTVTEKPAERVSRVWHSLGMSHLGHGGVGVGASE